MKYEAGQRFWSFTLVDKVGRTNRGMPIWLIRCDCGTELTRRVDIVRRGELKSCRACKGVRFPSFAFTAGTVSRQPDPVIDKSTGCWLWTGRLTDKGYGVISLKGKDHLTHRLSYMLHFGPIPDGLLVCHACDIPNCVNPDHLFLGTVTDNNRDCAAKGRGRGAAPITAG